MGFKHFRAHVVLRLALFAALTLAAVWGFTSTDWQLTPIVSGALALLVLIETVRYVESVNRELTSFLEFVTHDDFSSSFPIASKGRVFADLESAYSRLLDKYRGLNQARELNHRYLEALVEHVSVALLCLDDKGRVTLMNRQAKQLFKTPHLASLGSLRRIDPSLPAELEALSDGDRILIRVQVDGEPMQLALFVTEFQLLDHGYRLISFQNIRDELEQREVDFSQKLIKVLTHEIMNSVTPIISLCQVIEESLSERAAERPDAGLADAEPPDAELADAEQGAAELADAEQGAAELPDADDLLRSVASIQSRGDGLLRFVQAYRSLTSLPKPDRARVDVGPLLEQTVTLLAPTVDAANVALATRVDGDDLAIEADAEQIQQVLINLIKNAVEALDGRADGQILLSASKDEPGRTIVKIADNGPGIDEDQIENIFVPFFTTKRGGTGVGLSVSRQIMFLNRGLISVKSSPDHGAEFSLQFR